MTARIIDGKARAERATAEIKVQIAARVAAGKPPPGLAVVLVGEHPASLIYVRNKRRMTQAVGMKSFEFDLPGTVSQKELLTLIARLNADTEVHGILVQLPLPKEIDADVVTESIDPAKDVDGLHPYNMGRLVLKRPALRPCTWNRVGCRAVRGSTNSNPRCARSASRFSTSLSRRFHSPRCCCGCSRRRAASTCRSNRS